MKPFALGHGRAFVGVAALFASVIAHARADLLLELEARRCLDVREGGCFHPRHRGNGNAVFRVDADADVDVDVDCSLA